MFTASYLKCYKIGPVPAAPACHPHPTAANSLRSNTAAVSWWHQTGALRSLLFTIALKPTAKQNYISRTITFLRSERLQRISDFKQNS